MSVSESTSTHPRKFTLASRASQLAQVQTNAVRDQLAALHPEMTFETSFMTTVGGDRNKSQALYLLGGKALWTKELEVAMREGAAAASVGRAAALLQATAAGAGTLLPGAEAQHTTLSRTGQAIGGVLAAAGSSRRRR